MTPSGSQEETGKLAMQVHICASAIRLALTGAMEVQQLRDVASDRSRLVDELRSQNEAHEATVSMSWVAREFGRLTHAPQIATLKASLEDSHTTIRELRQSKADILAQKPGERNADLEARNTALEDTVRARVPYGSAYSYVAQIADLKKAIDSTTLEVAVGRVKRVQFNRCCYMPSNANTSVILPLSLRP